MKVKRTPLVLQSDTYSREYGVVRSSGAHLMSIVERILARGEKQAYDDWSEEHLEGLRTPGFIWERVMSDYAKSVNPHSSLAFPGEMFWCYQCDETIAGTTVAEQHCTTYKHKGIYYTPDAVVVPEWYPVEWKFTWKSSRRTGDTHIDGIPQWQYQLMWQAMGLESERAQLQAMFCRSDYSPGPPKCDAYVFDFEFTQKDLRRNKAMIVNTALHEGLL